MARQKPRAYGFVHVKKQQRKRPGRHSKKPNKKLADWINENLYYDQLILEYWKESDPNSGWVHCSFSLNGNRKQYLKAYKENGSTKYEQIF